MKSATQRRFGAFGAKFRRTRSAGFGPRPATVVRFTLPRTAPASPSARISRSIVQRATGMPSRFRTSHTFLGPYTPKLSRCTRRMCSSRTSSRC